MLWKKNRIINIVWWFERFYFSSFFITVCFFKGCLNPIQDTRGEEGGAKSFSPVSSGNVGISSQNFLTFKPIPTASPKLLTLNQGHFSKKVVFLVGYDNFDNFSHGNVTVTKLGHMAHVQYNLSHVL